MDPPVGLSTLSPRRLIVLLVVLGGVCSIGPIATDLFLPALPSVAADLGASTQSIALTMTTFLAGLALGQMLAGPLSDTYGRRRPLLVGMVVFTASSLLCAFTPSAGVLIALRAVQGLSGAAGLVIAYAVITDYVRGRRAARLLSRLAIISGVAPIIAPLAGAQILRFTSWRGVFVVVAALGLLLLVGVVFGMRESLPAERRSAGGLSTTLRTMSALSRDATFMGLSVSSALSFVAFFAYLAGSSFVYQDVYHVSPMTFSVLFSLNALGMLGANQLNHRLLARFRPRTLLLASLIVSAIAGAVVLAVALVGGLGLLALAVPLFVFVASLGLMMPDATAMALSLHPDAAGSASAYFGTMRLALGALATPLVGIGGSVSAVPMATVIAVSAVASLGVLMAIWRRTAAIETVRETPEEEMADMPVG